MKHKEDTGWKTPHLPDLNMLQRDIANGVADVLQIKENNLFVVKNAGKILQF